MNNKLTENYIFNYFSENKLTKTDVLAYFIEKNEFTDVILLFPKDVVPTSMVSYGAPFTLTIAANENVRAANDSATVAEDSGDRAVLGSPP